MACEHVRCLVELAAASWRAIACQQYGSCQQHAGAALRAERCLWLSGAGLCPPSPRILESTGRGQWRVVQLPAVFVVPWFAGSHWAVLTRQRANKLGNGSLVLYEVIHHTSLFGDVPPGFPPRHGRPGSSSPRAGGPSIGGYGGSSGQDPPVRTLHSRLAAGAGGSSRLEDGIRIRRGGVTGQRDAWVTKCRWLTKCMMQGSRSSNAQERDSNGAVQDSGRRSAHRGGRVLSLSL